MHPRQASEHFEDSDLSFARALIADDPAAWRRFQPRFEGVIVRCIHRVTRRFSRVTPEDMREIQGQLMLSLITSDHAKLRAYDPARGCSLSSYLGMLATRRAYDWLRFVRREPHREALAVAESLPGDQIDPYEAAVHQERAVLAARVMAGFSERDRAFATMYFAEGMDAGEIARSLKISVKTVYSKRHKIQSRLQSLVASLDRADRRHDLAA